MNGALQQAQTSLKTALGGLTGQGGDAFAVPGMGGEEQVDVDLDIDAEMPAEEPGVELPPIPDMDDEEELPTGGAGRAKR